MMADTERFQQELLGLRNLIEDIWGKDLSDHKIIVCAKAEIEQARSSRSLTRQRNKQLLLLRKALYETTEQLDAMNQSASHAASWVEPRSNTTTERIVKNRAMLSKQDNDAAFCETLAEKDYMALPRAIAKDIAKFIAIEHDSEGSACGYNFEVEKAAQYIADRLTSTRVYSPELRDVRELAAHIREGAYYADWVGFDISLDEAVAEIERTFQARLLDTFMSKECSYCGPDGLVRTGDGDGHTCPECGGSHEATLRANDGVKYDLPGTRERLISLLANDRWSKTFIRACFDKYDEVQVRLSASGQGEERESWVAYLRVKDYNGARPASIEVCNPGDPGAFPVYRQPAAPAPLDDRHKDDGLPGVDTPLSAPREWRGEAARLDRPPVPSLWRHRNRRPRVWYNALSTLRRDRR